MRRVFLAGAGVSANPPTNFPIARAIVDDLIAAIAPDDHTRDELRQLADAGRVGRQHGLDYLRFEALIETVQEMADDDLHVLDFVGLFRAPNALHELLAARAAAGDIVLTPNFDGLIEQSILDAGLLPSSIATDDAFRQWLESPLPDVVPVFKLHGTYEQFDGTACTRTAATMQATIESLTAERRERLLSEPKRDLLAHVTSDELVVIGYSGSDDFDIVPTLTRTNIAACTWIMHEGSHQPRDVTAAILADIAQRPAEEWSARDEFFHRQSRRGTLRILAVHSGAWLLSQYGLQWTDLSRQVPSLDAYWRTWANRYAASLPLKRLIAGELFARLSRYMQARQLFELAAAEVSPHQGLANIQLGRMLIRRGETGDFAAADAAVRRTVDGLAPDDIPGQARAWHDLGYVKYKRAQYDEALYWFDKVLDLPRTSETLGYVMRATHDKGVVLQDLGRHDEALPLLEQGLDLSWSVGDFTHVAWSLHHIALHHFYRAELAPARTAFAEARRTALAIGDLNYVSLVDHELALLDFFAGDVHASIEKLEAARNMGTTTGSKEFDATDLQHLGIAFLELGDLGRAADLFEHAERDYATVENHEDAAELLCYAAQLELERNDCAAAAAALQRADGHQPLTPDYRMRIAFMHAVVSVRCNRGTGDDVSDIVEAASAEYRRYLLLDLVYLAARFRAGEPSREPFRQICELIAAIYAQEGNARRADTIRAFLAAP